MKHKAHSNGRVMLAVTPDLVDTIWNALSFEKKVTLLGKM